MSNGLLPDLGQDAASAELESKSRLNDEMLQSNQLNGVL